MKINVTQEHIDKGLPGNCGFCAVALALKAAGFAEASVGDLTFGYFNEDGVRTGGQLPPRVSVWIRQFDNDRSQVSPFTFDLDVAA